MKVNKKHLQKLRNIESAAYPESFQMLQDVYTLDDLYGYCETDSVEVFIKGECYILIGYYNESYGKRCDIIDFAAIPDVEVNIFDFIKDVKQNILENQVSYVTCNCRKKTSYPIMMMLLKRMGFKNIQQTSSYWAGEEFVELSVQINE